MKLSFKAKKFLVRLMAAAALAAAVEAQAVTNGGNVVQYSEKETVEVDSAFMDKVRKSGVGPAKAVAMTILVAEEVRFGSEVKLKGAEQVYKVAPDGIGSRLVPASEEAGRAVRELGKEEVIKDAFGCVYIVRRESAGGQPMLVPLAKHSEDGRAMCVSSAKSLSI